MGLTATLGSGCDGVDPIAPVEPPARPNIVVIMTDDLDARMVSYLERVQTSLVREGTSFERFFVTTPVCCPSRTSVLRGQYAHNHGVRTNAAPDGGYARAVSLGIENSTLATWLQAAGYRTALIGKYLNEYSDERVPPGWDEWFAVHHPNRFRDFVVTDNGVVRRYGSGYQTDVLAGRALEFMYSVSAARDPFFLYLNTKAPHGPFAVPPRAGGRFAHEEIPRLPSFDEQDVSDKPEVIRRLPRLSEAEVAEMDEVFRGRLRSMLPVEDMLERLIEFLDERGLLDHTYVFFTSDNGFHLGEHRLRAGKGRAYEEDIRVPLIVRGPGIPRRSVVAALALNLDLAPTLVEIAGAAAPSFVDGRSLAALARGEPAPPHWRSGFVIESWTGGFRALRTPEQLFVRWGTSETEFYDMRTDPYQLDNRSAQLSESQEAELSRWIDGLTECAGAACRVADREPRDLTPALSASARRE